MRSDWRSTRGLVCPHWLLIVSLLLLLAPACTPQPLSVTREPTALRLVAADSCKTLMQDAASAYETAHPWVTVTSEVLNNALAADALMAGEADLALLSWDSVNGGGQPLWMESLTRDGVAVIVHPTLSFTEIGLVQLREIFLGRLQEWQGTVLTAVSREDGSGTRSAFESVVLQGGRTTLNAVVVPSSEAMVDYVASTTGAIGYVSAEYLDDRVRAVPIEGELPTEIAIATGDYPLWREITLASSGEPTGEARRFAQWLLRAKAAANQVGEVAQRP